MAVAEVAVTGEVPRHVAVVFVHGILANNDGFAGPMEKRLRKKLPKELRPFVHFRSVYWAATVRDNQSDYQVRMHTSGSTWHRKLRRLVIEGLGDAAAYQKTRGRDNSIYYEAQGKITDKIKQLRAQLKVDCPLIFVGHSLGCHVISSYLWDINHLKQRTAADIATEPDPAVRAQWEKLQATDAFGRLDTCAGIVTLGCNIPMFTFTFGPKSVFPVTYRPNGPNGTRLNAAFPGVALPKELQEQARWLNFYNRWDILGYPLKPLNDEYRNAEKIHDICLWSETPWFLPYAWCALAHKRYWTNRTVLHETAKLIREMIETPRVATSAVAATPAAAAVPALAASMPAVASSSP
jgi:pimeloyl-ACP methyl ester carboxylesterase